jgi:hypothetical protein
MDSTFSFQDVAGGAASVKPQVRPFYDGCPWLSVVSAAASLSVRTYGGQERTFM